MKAKRLLMVILAIAMMAVMAIPASAATQSTKTYKGTVKVDAEMDDEWKYAEEFTANEHESNHWTASTDPKTSSMKMRTLWDEDYVYVWCEITDPTVVTTKRASLWATDCMIYHLDYANDKTSGGFDANKAGYLYATAGEGLVQTSMVWEGAKEAFKYAQKMTSTGWIIEMGIPAKAIGLTIKEGDKLGFEPQYNDSNDSSASGGRVGLCTWNLKGAGGYNNTSLYGTLELSGVSPNKPSDKPVEDKPTEKPTESSPATSDNMVVFALLGAAALAGAAVVSKKRG